jgi:hypothetical protein
LGNAPVPLVSARSPANRLPRTNTSTSRLSSADRSVPESQLLTFLAGRSPLRVLVLLQAPTHPSGARFPGPSAHDVSPRGLRFGRSLALASKAAFSVSTMGLLTLPSPVCPPVQDSGPSR